jgi:hypothetical protein
VKRNGDDAMLEAAARADQVLGDERGQHRQPLPINAPLTFRRLHGARWYQRREALPLGCLLAFPDGFAAV